MPLTFEPLETRENPAGIVNPLAFQTAFDSLTATVREVLTSPKPPSAVAVSAFVGTTLIALNDQIITPTEQGQIAQAAARVLLESNVPVTKLAQIVLDVYTIRASIF